MSPAASARTRSSISVPVAYQRVSCPCSFLKGLYRIRNQRFVSTDWSLEVSHQRYLHLRFRPSTTADHHRFSNIASWANCASHLIPEQIRRVGHSPVSRHWRLYSGDPGTTGLGRCGHCGCIGGSFPQQGASRNVVRVESSRDTSTLRTASLQRSTIASAIARTWPVANITMAAGGAFASTRQPVVSYLGAFTRAIATPSQSSIPVAFGGSLRIATIPRFL
jgi:hypothetical protein